MFLKCENKTEFSTSDKFMCASFFIFEILFLNTYINLFALKPIYDLLQIACAFFSLMGIILAENHLRDTLFKLLFVTLCFNLMLYFAMYSTDEFLMKYNLLFLSSLPLLYSVYFFNCNQNIKGILKKSVVIFFVLGILTTTNGCIIHPMAAKYQATTYADNTEYYRLNVFGYSQMHMLIFSLPMFKYMVKNKIVSYFLLIGTFVSLFFTQYTIALFIAVLSVIYMIVLKLGKNSTVSILFCCFLFLFVFIIKTPLARLILDFSQSIDSNRAVLSERISAIGNFLLGDTDRSLSSRLDLYVESITSFLKSPFIGNFLSSRDLTIGGHSAIFDLLATTGIFGALVLVVNLRLYLKNTIAKIPSSDFKNKYIVALVITFLLSCVNTFFSYPAMSFGAFLLPVLCYNDQNEKTENRL